MFALGYFPLEEDDGEIMDFTNLHVAHSEHIQTRFIDTIGLFSYTKSFIFHDSMSLEAFYCVLHNAHIYTIPHKEFTDSLIRKVIMGRVNTHTQLML